MKQRVCIGGPDLAQYFPARFRDWVPNRVSASTRLDLAAALAVVALVAVLVLPLMANTKSRSEQVGCVNNLRQIGQGVRSWASEHNNQNPWWVSFVEGGTKPIVGSKGGSAWFEFFFTHRELVTPKIFLCPSDSKRNMATNFTQFSSGGYRNNALSYFLGLHSYFDEPYSLLSGDYNLPASGYPATCSAGVNNASTLRPRSPEIYWMSINRFGTGGGDQNSTFPLISWDARYVVFTSAASNLVDTPINSIMNIYVRDRILGTTLLVSPNRFGSGSGNGKSVTPCMAANGRTVVFQSFANDLVEGDYNGTSDIFVLQLGGQDSDGDGLEDDWELAYFGDLSRDGSGDEDGDGHSDRQEFLTGTDPTNQGSVLRVFTLASVSGGPVTLFWNAVPGRHYRVQFKTNITDTAWNGLSGEIVANSTSASALDPETGSTDHRFYRAVCEP